MLSLHIIADNAGPARLDRAVDYLKRTKQTAVQVAGGSQIDRAMHLAERIRSELPAIEIYWRVLEDTGSVAKWSAGAWFEWAIKPHLNWMQQLKTIMVVDNESSGDDAFIRYYTEQSRQRAKILHDNGLYGAFCRFATGNIQEHQYALLKPLLDELKAGDRVSPNEYSNRPGLSSGGHLERWKRLRAVTNNPLTFSIGECGVLNDYRAHDGYLNFMSGRDMALQLVSEEMWYNGGTIPRFLFAIGGYQEWNSLQVNDEVLTTLEEYYAAHPIGQPPPPSPFPPPPPPTPVPPPTVAVLRVTLEMMRNTLQSQVELIDAILDTNQ